MDTVFGEQKLKTGDVVTTDGVFRVYQQPYSIVVGDYVQPACSLMMIPVRHGRMPMPTLTSPIS